MGINSRDELFVTRGHSTPRPQPQYGRQVLADVDTRDHSFHQLLVECADAIHVTFMCDYIQETHWGSITPHQPNTEHRIGIGEIAVLTRPAITTSRMRDNQRTSLDGPPSRLHHTTLFQPTHIAHAQFMIRQQAYSDRHLSLGWRRRNVISF